MTFTNRTIKSRRALSTLAAAGLAMSMVGGLAGCGDDDEAAGPTTVEVSVPSGDPSVEPGVDPGGIDPTMDEPGGRPTYVANPDPTVDDAACDAWAAGMGAIHQAPQGPDADVGAYFDAEVLPHTLELVDSVDADLTSAARSLHESLTHMASSGDPSVLESPAFTDAQAKVGEALHVGCDWAAVTLQADEYVFEQAPTRLAAGRYSFALENVGVEDHEMVLFRANDGVTESFDELASLGEGMMEEVTFTGVAFGGPGTTAFAAIDLEPGTYFLVCFIPVGGGEDGPPHFMQGMQETLTVV